MDTLSNIKDIKTENLHNFLCMCQVSLNFSATAGKKKAALSSKAVCGGYCF